MKSAIFLLVVLSQVAWAQLGPGDHTLTIPGRPEGTRTFRVHVPQLYATSPSAAVVFAWHGFTERCDQFAYTGYNAVSDQAGFIVAYPCGTGPLPSFNAGVCCGNNRNDDVEFARLMVLTLRENFPKVNVSRVFSSGFSNGGMMSEQLACKASHVFRAVASVGGTCALNPGNAAAFDECDKFYANSTRRAAVLLIHGTLDPVVPFIGNPLLRFPPVPADHQRWAQRNKCVGEPETTFKKGAFSNLVYQNCPSGPVELVIQEGGVHVWPNTADFRSQEYAWKFFSQF